MKALKKLLVSVLGLALCCTTFSAEAAKKGETSESGKKQSVKQSGKKAGKKTAKDKKAEKNKKIVPTESFYDKMWEKFKVGNKRES